MNRVLGIAAAAVCFAAADTYVVVLALPDMMTATGVDLDELQRAAPIISGFLLGYVALLPLAGKLADLHGRRQLLVAGLLLFAVGSMITAASYDLPSMVTGRFLQGLGAGALVPATLALVADLYPPDRRGAPLGWVGAAQELGSVLGPLLGALVLALGTWRDIFWLNLVVGLVFTLLLVAAPVSHPKGPLMDALDHAIAGGPPAKRARLSRPTRLTLALLTAISLSVVMVQPRGLVDSVTWGGPFVPWPDTASDAARWLSPAGVIALALVVAFVTSLRPWRWPAVLRGAGVVGACLIALALGSIVLAFASTHPERHAVSSTGWLFLVAAAVFAILFVLHERRSRLRLVPATTFRSSSAWGSLVVSLFVGAALVAALVDVPLAARLTVYPDSQLGAALLLVRMLVAVPVGAVIGGRLTRRLPVAEITAAGLALTAIAFVLMTRWGITSLEHWQATIPLVLAGLGFGLTIAPVNSALFAATPNATHGLASGFLVVARMVGMLAGLSILTAVGLHRFYEASEKLPTIAAVCGGSGRCDAYDDLLTAAAMTQVHAVFTGAAVCALVATVVSIVLLRAPHDRASDRVAA